MNINSRTVRGHALVSMAVAMGIAGMGMVFAGAMHASFEEVSRGVPLLLVGLWWSGRELGRSMDASRARRMAGVPPVRRREEKPHTRGAAGKEGRAT